jgi:hypothetical protein
MRAAILVLCVFFGACADEATAPLSPGTPVRELTLSQPPILRVGQTTQLVATAVFVDGRSMTVTNGAGWQSSLPNVATVTSGGLVVAVSIGLSTVTATYGGATASVLINVFVPPPPQGLTAGS